MGNNINFIWPIKLVEEKTTYSCSASFSFLSITGTSSITRFSTHADSVPEPSSRRPAAAAAASPNAPIGPVSALLEKNRTCVENRGQVRKTRKWMLLFNRSCNSTRKVAVRAVNKVLLLAVYVDAINFRRLVWKICRIFQINQFLKDIWR